MVPGAVDVLPLNVQLSVLPPLLIVHVSVSEGPETPKLAVAAVGCVTLSAADFETPPYDPVIVAEIVPPTALVEIVNVALVEPAGTVTLAGTETTGSLPDNETTAPPVGAGPVSVTVPFKVSPPTTLDAPSDSDERAGPAVTVSAGDCLLLPLNDAVIVTVPAETAVTVNAAVVAPAWTVIAVSTLAIAVLLLDSEMLDAAVAGAASVTVPCPVPPAGRLVGLTATLATAAVVVGPDGEFEPH
jgi:hypothetical protein